ncbi:MAG: biotin--[acetyl-CoA-carboxylase] ligase [Chitinophagaceae bacterium]
MSHPSASNPIGTPITELPSIDSTNNYALAKVHAGLAQHGMAFFAHEQVQGKGQRGKSWSSGKDTSVILSVVVNPKSLLLSQQFHLSACVAVSVYEFFSTHAGDDTAIKWPNDLYWQDRKAGGILIENVVRGGTDDRGQMTDDQSAWQWSVIGIGININQEHFSKELKNPVSLRQITGKEFDPLELAKQICGKLDKNLNVLSAGVGGFEKILSLYNDHLYKWNEKVKLKRAAGFLKRQLKAFRKPED